MGYLNGTSIYDRMKHIVIHYKEQFIYFSHVPDSSLYNLHVENVTKREANNRNTMVFRGFVDLIDDERTEIIEIDCRVTPKINECITEILIYQVAHSKDYISLGTSSNFIKISNITEYLPESYCIKFKKSVPYLYELCHGNETDTTLSTTETMRTDTASTFSDTTKEDSSKFIIFSLLLVLILMLI